MTQEGHDIAAIGAVSKWPCGAGMLQGVTQDGRSQISCLEGGASGFVAATVCSLWNRAWKHIEAWESVCVGR